MTGFSLAVVGCDASAVAESPSSTTTTTIEPAPTTSTTTTTIEPPPTTSTTVPRPALPPIPPPNPGKVTVISKGPVDLNQIALTIDDGFSPPTVAAYIAFAERTRIPITFSPNGSAGKPWLDRRDTLQPLIERGQVQIGNHTWSHANLPSLGEQAIEAELERNEAWIERSFGITARPWFRPPFGTHNETVRGVAGRLGFTNLVLWNGTFSDASNEGSEQLLGFARRYLHAGVVMLGHANQPAVTRVFDQIVDILEERGLQPVTLDAMFGTSRASG